MTMVNAARPQTTNPGVSPRRKTMVEPPQICDPSDDRCVQFTSHNFLPGISVRHSPSCTGQVCSLFACDGGNWRVTSNGTLDRAEWIKGWIATQLFTPRYIDCNEHPLAIKRGGWWADAFRGGGQPFQSGSKLYALLYRHGGARPESLVLAEQYAKEALTYLVTWGIVSRITVHARWAAHGKTGGAVGSVIHLAVNVAGPGLSSTFEAVGGRIESGEYLWREYVAPRALQSIPGRIYGRVTPPRQ